MSKAVFVSGADRGLGLELVRKLLKDGYTVFAGRYLEEWKGLDELKNTYGENLQTVKMDIGSTESVKEAGKYIVSKTDKLDFIINNAAVLGDIEKTIHDELDFDEMQKVFNVNSLGPLRVANSLIPLLIKGETKLLVNISSEAGSIGETSWRRGWFAYCMSKAALNMESAIIHNSLKDVGGQVMVIHPGHMSTYMRGEIDSTAAMTPAQSAEQIIGLVYNHEKYKGEKPVFIDYAGNKMEW